MWSNLKNVRSTIVQAVAPQEEDDSEEGSAYDEDDDEYYDDDDEEYSDVEEDEKGTSAPRSPFGFVGILSRALDQEQNDYNHSHREESDGEDEMQEVLFSNDQVVPGEQISFSRKAATDSAPNVPERHALNQDPEPQPVENTTQPKQSQVSVDSSPNEASLEQTVHESDGLDERQSSTQDMPSSFASPRRSKAQLSPRLSKDGALPALVREKGSVSPAHHRLSQQIFNRNSSSSDEQQDRAQTLKLKSPLTEKQASASESQSPSNAVKRTVMEKLAVPFPSDSDLEPLNKADFDGGTGDSTDSDALVAAHTGAATHQPESHMEALAKNPLQGAEKQMPPQQSTPPGLQRASSREAKAASKVLDKSRQPLPTPQSSSSHAEATVHEPNPMTSGQSRRAKELKDRCETLEEQLRNAESRVLQLQQETAVALEQSDSHDEELFLRFQEKEARLLEAAAEDHRREMDLMRGELEGRLAALIRQLVSEQGERSEERQRCERLIEEAERRAKLAERELERLHIQQESAISEAKIKHERATSIAENKLAQTMALLDDREEQIAELKNKLQNLRSTVTEHQEGAEEVEEEMDELHSENETLRHHVEDVEAECANLRQKVDELHADSEKLSVVKMELRMLKEEKERDTVRIQSAAASAASASGQLENERDALKAEVQDLQRQLAAAVADVGIAKSDTERVMTANANLQSALEAFQSEREAELALMDDQRRELEEASAAAHAAALEATHEANDARLREMKLEFEHKMKQLHDDVRGLEEKNDKLRLDNVQTRRSLDEAIQRLQATQEDVIDRTLMKNILLDWLTKPGAKERRQVLELMANLLNFSEAEKEKVHIDEVAGTIGKVVGSVAAPLPPPKADVEHLEGDNVREKWVNFLLAETDD